MNLFYKYIHLYSIYSIDILYTSIKKDFGLISIIICQYVECPDVDCFDISDENPVCGQYQSFYQTFENKCMFDDFNCYMNDETKVWQFVNDGPCPGDEKP